MAVDLWIDRHFGPTSSWTSPYTWRGPGDAAKYLAWEWVIAPLLACACLAAPVAGLAAVAGLLSLVFD